MGHLPLGLVSVYLGGVEFLLLIAALACSMAWQFLANRNLERLKSRVDGHAESIGHMDDWAEAVDARLSIFEAERAAGNLNVARVTGGGVKTVRLNEATPELIDDEGPLTTERVRTIIMGLRRPASTRIQVADTHGPACKTR